MDTLSILATTASLLVALAALGELVFKLWRVSQNKTKRPRK
jgi:hypothetical protein